MTGEELSRSKSTTERDMSETHWTKGRPWTAVHFRHFGRTADGIIQRNDDGKDDIPIKTEFETDGMKTTMFVASAYFNVGRLESEAIANARLIASSPGLYDALHGLLEMYISMINSGDYGNWNPEEEEEVIAARIALRKARGETA